jgi:gluconolactonase
VSVCASQRLLHGSACSSSYAFDVVQQPSHADPSAGGPHLTNRRLFAFVDSGAPDGIKVDRSDNVYVGCFDGIHVWNSSGLLLGKIMFARDDGRKDGCANFCFLPGGRLVCMAEDRMYLVEGMTVEGALLSR